MAHFYGSMEGGRGSKTVTGHKTTGLSAHLRGWNIGVQVTVKHNAVTGKDEIHVVPTGGSNNPGKSGQGVVFTEGE